MATEQTAIDEKYIIEKIYYCALNVQTESKKTDGKECLILIDFASNVRQVFDEPVLEGFTFKDAKILNKKSVLPNATAAYRSIARLLLHTSNPEIELAKQAKSWGISLEL